MFKFSKVKQRDFSIEQRLYSLAQRAKHSIISVDELKSLQLCSIPTLRVTLTRMQRKGALVRLARGLYYVPRIEERGAPPEDLMYAAQLMYGGYLAFATALYFYHLIDEVPFTIFVATRSKSASKRIGAVEIRAIALRERAVGAVQHGDYRISSLAKTLYDCIHLPEHGGGESRIVAVLKRARLSKEGWREFWSYVRTFEKNNKKFLRRLCKVFEKAGIKPEKSLMRLHAIR